MVQHALRYLEQGELEMAEKRREMEEHIALALAEADNGDFVAGDEFMQEMLNELDRMAKSEPR